MKRRLFRLPLFAALASLAALPAAAAPEVVTDIPPVHSLAARVMQGVGEPASILPPGATPHGYSMRPSEAARLQAADIVFWVGEGLTPWLEDAVESLAAGRRVGRTDGGAGGGAARVRRGGAWRP